MRLKKKQGWGEANGILMFLIHSHLIQPDAQEGQGEGYKMALHLIAEHPVKTRGDGDWVPTGSQKARILFQSLLSAFLVSGPVLGIGGANTSQTASCPKRIQSTIAEINL